MSAEPLLVLCPCPSNTVAGQIITALIEQNLVACVNRIGGVKSWYRWKGQIQQDEEVLLLIKTTRDLLGDVEAMIGKLHPYELPEVIAVSIAAGSADYLRWLAESTAR